MSAFAKVSTLADLETLDVDQITEGYLSAERGDPEPGENRGRAYWHGWCNRMRDYGELPQCAASVSLVTEYARKLRGELVPTPIPRQQEAGE